MTKQEQVVGDGSTSQQAGRDLIVTGTNYAEVREIVTDLMKGELAIAQLEAQKEMSRRLEHFAEKLVPALIEKNIAAERFSKPEVQLFVHDTQRRFLESGLEAPQEITIDLVTQSLGEVAGSPRQLIFKEAAKISSSLNAPTANFISLLFILTRTKKEPRVPAPTYSTKFDLDALAKVVIDTIEADVRRLEPLPRLSQMDKDHLRTIGVLEFNAFSGFHPDAYWKQSAGSFPKPLDESEVAALRALGAREQDFVRLKASDPYAFVVPESTLDFSNFGWNGSHSVANLPDNSWRKDANWKARIEQKGGPVIEDALSRAAEQSSTIALFRTMHSDGIIGSETLTPVGLAIGLSNARRAGMALDDKIWFPD